MDVIVSQGKKKNKEKSFSCGSLLAIAVKADNATVTRIDIPKKNVVLTLTTACTNKPVPARLYVSTANSDFLCIGSLHDQKPMVNMGIQFTDSIQLKAELIKSSGIDVSGLSINIFGTVQPLPVFSPLGVTTLDSSVPTTNEVKKVGNSESTNSSDSFKTKNNKKRKLSADENNDAGEKKQQPETNLEKSEDDIEPLVKLTKKERKRLAKQKAMELEQVLHSQQKEEKKDEAHAKKETNSPQKKKKEPAPITQQRRMDGGLLVRDIIIGSGTAVKSGKKVSIHYEGKLTDSGKVFDRNNSRSSPLTFRIGTGQVIKGLERGMEGMRVGGERVLTIPSSLGYGAKGSGNVIPKNAGLTFTVKLLSIGAGR